MEQQIENLAQFMYLGYRQEFWSSDLNINPWNSLGDKYQNAWRAAAKVAIEFLEEKKKWDTDITGGG